MLITAAKLVTPAGILPTTASYGVIAVFYAIADLI